MTIVKILLFFALILLALFYVNRGAPKILEATIVIVITMIGALSFVTKNDPLDKTITPIYFVNIKEKKVVFFRDKPVLAQYYLDQDILFSRKLSMMNRGDFIDGQKTIVQMHAIAILDYLSKNYGDRWDVKRENINVPGGGLVTFYPREPGNDGRDIQKYTKDMFPESIKQNVFFDDLHQAAKLALPKRTKFEYREGDANQPSMEIRFYKEWAFDIRIGVVGILSTVGLGDVGKYIGLTNPEEGFLFLKPDNPISQTYKNIILLVKCRADFYRFTSGRPDVIRYKEWAETMFNDLYETFDRRVLEDKLRSHQQTLGAYKIIKEK